MPREAVIASIASSQRAGLPMRIALATVSGCGDPLPWTSGAAPSAWKPNSRGATPSLVEALPVGGDVARVADGDAQRVELVEPSMTSKAAVFWPSRRNGFTELTSAIGWRSVSARTSVSAWSKLPRSAMTRAPCMRAWASLPVAILPSGTMTAQVSPARAA